MIARKQNEQKKAPGPDAVKLGKKARMEDILAIADRFRSKIRGQFSSADINDILYDEDGLPK